jgi:type VI secretion system protein ImpK
MPALNQTGNSDSSAVQREDNLALIFQEVFTVIERLRANRQRVADAEAFRSQVRHALRAAEQEAVRIGYSAEDVRVAVFAVVAFLDESVLNMQSAVFADWPAKPLQEELFNVHIAGEVFFKNVERLLAASDSRRLADLLEVHELCLLLGFRGRFSASSPGEIRSVISQIEEKIRRIRGPAGPMSPSWNPGRPRDAAKAGGSSRKWVVLAAICWIAAAVLFATFFVLLNSEASALESLAARISL